MALGYTGLALTLAFLVLALRLMPSVPPALLVPAAKQPATWRLAGVVIANLMAIATVAATIAPAGVFGIIGWLPAVFFAALTLRCALCGWRHYRGHAESIAKKMCVRIAAVSVVGMVLLPLTYQLADVFALLPLDNSRLQRDVKELAAHRHGVARLQALAPTHLPSGLDEAALTDLQPMARRLRIRLRYATHVLTESVTLPAMQGGHGPWVCVAPIYTDHLDTFARHFARRAYLIGSDGLVRETASPSGTPPCAGRPGKSWPTRTEDITYKPLYETVQRQPHPQTRNADDDDTVRLSLTALWFFIYAIPVALVLALALRIADRSRQFEIVPALVAALVLYVLAGATLRWPLAFAGVAVLTGAIMYWLLRRAQTVFTRLTGVLKILAWLLPLAWLWGLFAFHDIQGYAGARSLVVEWATRQQALSDLAANPVRQDIYVQRFPALSLDDFRRQQARFAGADHGAAQNYRLEVEGDPAHGNLVAHLVPTRLPAFPFAQWVGAWAMQADATGALRACRVHAVLQRCPTDAPVLETLTPFDGDYLAGLAQPVLPARPVHPAILVP